MKARHSTSIFLTDRNSRSIATIRKSWLGGNQFELKGGPPSGMRPADYKLASPMNHISPRTPPLMLSYGGADTQVGVETADRFVIALGQAGLKDVSYHRRGMVDHCPHSLVRVPWLVPAVNEFFLRTLRSQP